MSFLNRAGYPYQVAIRKNATGEIRLRDMAPLKWSNDEVVNWTVGNFACDCNREWEFKRAGGELDENKPPCGNVRFTVLYALLENGIKIPIESGR